MKFALLIYAEEKNYMSKSPATVATFMAKVQAFEAFLRSNNHLLSQARLQPTQRALSIQNKDGEQVVFDGPFAETKEQLGGFYLVEAKDVNEVKTWVKRLPHEWDSIIEIRPVLETLMPELEGKS